MFGEEARPYDHTTRENNRRERAMAVCAIADGLFARGRRAATALFNWRLRARARGDDPAGLRITDAERNKPELLTRNHRGAKLLGVIWILAYYQSQRRVLPRDGEQAAGEAGALFCVIALRKNMWGGPRGKSEARALSCGELCLHLRRDWKPSTPASSLPVVRRSSRRAMQRPFAAPRALASLFRVVPPPHNFPAGNNTKSARPARQQLFPSR